MADLIADNNAVRVPAPIAYNSSFRRWPFMLVHNYGRVLDELLLERFQLGHKVFPLGASPWIGAQS